MTRPRRLLASPAKIIWLFTLPLSRIKMKLLSKYWLPHSAGRLPIVRERVTPVYSGNPSNENGTKTRSSRARARRILNGGLIMPLYCAHSAPAARLIESESADRAVNRGILCPDYRTAPIHRRFPEIREWANRVRSSWGDEIYKSMMTFLMLAEKCHCLLWLCFSHVVLGIGIYGE